MSITKEAILQASNGGLDVFRYLLPGDWKVGKSFKNPLYQDKKASCYIYLDKVSKVYKIKDFGDPDFAGDCFFLVGKMHNKNCSDRQDFIEILQIIDQEMMLNLNEVQSTLKSIRNQYYPAVKLASEIAEKEVQMEEEEIPFVQPTSKAFTETELNFWKQYGITTKILEAYNVVSIFSFESKNKEGKPYKLNSSASEPIFGYLANKFIKIYRPHSTIRFLYAGKMKQGYVFGLEQLPTRADVLYITGGEKDVMSLVAHGFNAICFNSETANIPKKIIKRLAIRFKHIVLLYDCDKTGVESMEKHCKELKEYDVKSLRLPLSGTKADKDISDFFRAGKTAKDLLTLFCTLLDALYEETMAVLKSCEIDFNNPPQRPEPLISINDVTIGSPGNLLCITGSEGSGKTNYLGGLISGAICSIENIIDTLGTDIKNNSNSKAVIIYDTEQSEDQLYRNLSFILKRALLPAPPTWFKAYCMVGLSRKDRMQSIFQSLDKFHYEYGGIHMVVIDGIADLIDGVNDEEKSVALIDELFRLAGIYRTCIICVLHMSPSGMKLRGHLGSEMQRKASGILSIEKDDDTNISIVKALKVRDGNALDVPLIQFQWDKEKNHHVYIGPKSKEDSVLSKVSDLSKVAIEIFSNKSSYSYQDLIGALSESLGVKERMARNYLKFMKEHEIIAKTGNETNMYTLAIAPY